MNNENFNFFANQSVQIDLGNFIISLIVASILSLLIQFFYIKFSSTLSNRIHFSKNFIVLGVTTAIIIMIVKNNLNKK